MLEKDKYLKTIEKCIKDTHAELILLENSTNHLDLENCRGLKKRLEYLNRELLKYTEKSE
jgi:hemerythrin